MRIFGNELKKLLNLRLLLILLLFSGLFYYMFLNFDFNWYPNGHPSVESLELRINMLKKYGLRIDAAEQKEFETVDYAAIKQAANRKIAGIKAFRDAKITTVDEFEALDAKLDDASRKLTDNLFNAINESVTEYTPPRSDAYYMYQEARDAIHNKKDNAILAQPPAGAAQKRIYSIEKRAANEGIPVISDIMSGPLPTWTDLMSYLSVLLLFTVAILISPYLIRERRNGVRALAYPCKKGRSLFTTQFGAALVVAAGAEIVQLAVFLITFCNGRHRDDLLFLKCDVSYEKGTWWDMTFFQYMVWSCIILFLMAFGFAMVSFAVSKLCKNYVTALAVQIPLIFLAGKLCGKITATLFDVSQAQYFTPLVCGLCVLVPLAFCLFLCHREKATDILP